MQKAIRHLLAGLCLVVATLAGAAAAGPSSVAIGTVWRIQDEVHAYPEKGQPARRLEAGSPIHAGERIRASARGEALIKMQDAGLIAVRPNSEFVVERFAANGKASDHQVVQLLAGAVRIVTGWIGKLNRAEHKVITPQATIGIRGTDHEPYVLSRDMARGSAHRPGTYNKVNRGSTVLAVDDSQLAIDPGRVGFARAAPPSRSGDAGEGRTRALMTLLLPVLLDKVPDFYLPGAFDSEIDAYSADAARLSDAALAALGQPAATPAASCDPDNDAGRWIADFDRAIEERNGERLIALFAPQATARATVRTRDQQMRSIDFDRADLVDSTLQAVASLSDYSHQRLSLSARSANPACSRLRLRSLVIEQGKLAGKPYRFESIEEFELERIDGQWLAIRLETTQR